MFKRRLRRSINQRIMSLHGLAMTGNRRAKEELDFLVAIRTLVDQQYG